MASQEAVTGGTAAFSPTSQQSSGFEYTSGASPTSTPQINNNGNPANSSSATSAVASVYSPPDGTGPSNFAQSGSGLASSGYSYLGGPAGSSLHLLTYDNETDIQQHLTSFEQNEMMSWFGEYFPNDVLGFYPDPNIG